MGDRIEGPRGEPLTTATSKEGTKTVHLQVRIVAATLLFAVLAIGTGTVLLLGYLLAAFSIGVIIFIMTRKMIKRIADARLASLRLLPRSATVTPRAKDENQRLAA